MMVHARDTNVGHQLFMNALDGAVAAYQSLPALERIAIVAQLLGGMMAEAPRNFDNDEIMRTVSANIALGNQAAAAGKVLVGTGSGPTGFDN